MPTIGQTIRNARTKRGLAPADVAEAVGVTVQALYQWETEATNPSALNMVKLINFLDFDIRTGDVNLSENNIQKYGAHIVPLLSITVPKGPWSIKRALELQPNPPTYVLERRALGDVFALRAEDDSNTPTVQANDILLFDSGRDPNPGEMVAVSIGDEPTIKIRKYRPRGADGPDYKLKVDFAPLNLDYPSEVRFVPDEARVVATLIEHRRLVSRL